MEIYLHEVIRVVPGQEELYCSSMIGHSEGTRYLGPDPPPPGEPAPLLTVGQFRTAQVSGSWPAVINLWAADAWEDRVARLKMQFAGGESAFLEEWWNRNLTLRRGGYDRILLPAAYSPPMAAFERGEVRGRVFLHEIVRVPFGEADAYLERLGQTFLPAAGRFGWQLVGAYRVALRPCEVLTIWAMREWPMLSRLLAAAGSDAELRDWQRYREAIVTGYEEMVMLPVRVSPLYLAPA